MATTVNQTRDDRRLNPLDNTLAQAFTINWEVMLYIVILALAIFTRFYALGDRAMSHDESLHTYYSYELYSEGNFSHTPLMHGPILFHANAFFYALFGDNDFSARLYTAILGVALVMSPLLFRRWLGRWGTILACTMLLISPLILYYNRYIRHDTPSILSAILMVWAIFMYLNGPADQRRRAHWLYILSAAMIWNLGSKETAFIYIAIFGLFMTLYWFARMAQTAWDIPGKLWFYGGIMATLIAGVAALGMYIVLDITPLERMIEIGNASGWMNDIETRSFVIWTLLVSLTVIGIVTGTVLYAFRNNLSRIPGREITIILGIAAIVLVGLIVVEELSHISTSEDATVSLPADPTDPNSTEVVENTSDFSWFPVLIPWVLMVVLVAGLWHSRNAGWWDWLDQFAELDVLIVMGALILPWLTAVFIVAARGSPSDFAAIGNSVPGFVTSLLPVAGATAIGQFVVGFLAWLPMTVIAIATGITWNWRRFLVCFVIFHVIFAFFFTTMFTNIQGLRGQVWSLQYWLEQQAERRGDQPQYYYLLIIMPMYEFLPIVGSVLAMLSGLVLFWRRRGDYVETQEQAQLAEVAAMIDNDPSYDNPDSDEDAYEETPSDDDLADLEYPAASKAPPARNVAVTANDSGTLSARLDNFRYLTQVPFLLFVGWWAILNLIGYTLAGEKMPWLGTHLTTPMIFLSAWYFGGIFDRIQWPRFLNRGWVYLVLIPLLLIAAFQLIGQPLGGRPPFAGSTVEQLTWTNNWLASLAVVGLVAYAIYRMAETTGWPHFRRMVAVAVFALLAVLTFRAAWMASFINYDLATEFLVYAHATPGTKLVVNQLTEISERTTDDNDLRFAYDNKLSWPGVWYFRDFDNDVFMGETPTLQNMNDAVVILVGDTNVGVVEPLLEDRYQRFDYKRMWWPMMEYFNLNAARVINTFDLSPENTQAAQLRRGIFDIWWSRDYTVYGQAINRSFDLSDWPVSENMYMYVRRDVAAQIWPYGVGDGTPLVLDEDFNQPSACVTNWQEPFAITVFDSASAGLNLPIGLGLDPEGRVVVAEDAASRLSIFDSDGNFIEHFGQPGDATQSGAVFQRPNGVAFDDQGNMYVADTWNYQVKVFNPDGELISAWGSPVTGGFNAEPQPFDGLWGPRDIAVDANQNVYVSDTGNKRVRVYDINGNYLRDIGTGGSGLGQLDEQTGLAIHPDGRLFVADYRNFRISVFTLDGTFLEVYNLNAWAEDLGNRPYIALDVERDYLYIGDPDTGRILVYDTTLGECLGAFGRLNRQNPNASEFNTIGGIAVDDDGFVYVVDVATNRVLKFEPFQRMVEDVTEGDQEGVLEVDIPPQADPEATNEVTAPDDEEVSEANESSEVDAANNVDEAVETDEVEPELTDEVGSPPVEDDPEPTNADS